MSGLVQCSSVHYLHFVGTIIDKKHGHALIFARFFFLSAKKCQSLFKHHSDIRCCSIRQQSLRTDNNHKFQLIQVIACLNSNTVETNSGFFI